MANREKGEVDLPIGDKVYTLVLNTNAIAALEGHVSTPDHDITLGEVLYSMARGSHRYTRAFVWACLRRDHKDITIERTGDLIDQAGGVEKLFEALAALKSSAHPDVQDHDLLAKTNKDRPQTPRRKRGTGAGVTSTRGASA